jgi:hypothetical protein
MQLFLWKTTTTLISIIIKLQWCMYNWVTHVMVVATRCEDFQPTILCPNPPLRMLCMTRVSISGYWVSGKRRSGYLKPYVSQFPEIESLFTCNTTLMIFGRVTHLFRVSSWVFPPCDLTLGQMLCFSDPHVKTPPWSLVCVSCDLTCRFTVNSWISRHEG